MGNLLKYSDCLVHEEENSISQKKEKIEGKKEAMDR